MADQLKERIWELESEINWFHDFIDHVQLNRYRAFDAAVQYADKKEKERLSDV